MGAFVRADMLGRNLRAHLTDITQVVKDAPKLVVADLGRHEVIESSDFIKWWNGATVVRRYAVARMADEKCKMKLAQYVAWNNRWVSRLGFGSVGIRSNLRSVDHAIGVRLKRTDTSLFSGQRRSDRRRYTIRRNKIVNDILDEETLALLKGKYLTAETL